eukprot:4858363-Prymnesium_polylepis.1
MAAGIQPGGGEREEVDPRNDEHQRVRDGQGEDERQLRDDERRRGGVAVQGVGRRRPQERDEAAHADREVSHQGEPKRVVRE